MEHKLKNRYGEEITFIQEGTLFEMWGGNYYRYLFNTESVLKDKIKEYVNQNKDE